MAANEKLDAVPLLIIYPFTSMHRVVHLFVGCHGERLRFGEHPPTHHNPPGGQCVRNVIQRVRVEKHDISYFARLQAAQQISRSHRGSASLRSDLQYLDR